MDTKALRNLMRLIESRKLLSMRLELVVILIIFILGLITKGPLGFYKTPTSDSGAQKFYRSAIIAKTPTSPLFLSRAN